MKSLNFAFIADYRDASAYFSPPAISISNSPDTNGALALVKARAKRKAWTTIDPRCSDETSERKSLNSA